jgi:hypothetical protein
MIETIETVASFIFSGPILGFLLFAVVSGWSEKVGVSREV